MGDLITIVVGAVAGGVCGWVGALLSFRRARRARSGDDAAEAIRAAMGAAARLRSLYQDAAIATWGRGPSDRDLAAAENEFVGACDRSADEELARAARAYLHVGRAYASGDQDTGTLVEEAARDELAALMRRLVREAQAP
ncbi:hypothetical protein [Quadrisphaera sp. DSM 44207]|uniref:hypothetical protein n=1 Tax=Quadrisphaera sp. DSM 44207 TaxID=1881057 RepID=UPI0008833AA8|nr:hypothetical protein [Quadrisphaera sp. DSM 44207]SDQ10218.1 hypothetical protein SAMN05428996_0534 [Quadrisphaera sp. DSM 44207]